MAVLETVLSIIVMILFLLTGVSKLLQGRQQFGSRIGDKGQWTTKVSDRQFLVIGTLELLGAVCILIGTLFSSLAVLVPIAAAVLALMMVFAVLLHIWINDPVQNIIPASLFCSLALMVVLLNTI